MRGMVWVCGVAVLCMSAACNPPAVSTVSDEPSAKATDAAPELGTDIRVPFEGFLHVDTGTRVTYRNNPPASGMHWPDDAEPMFYDIPIPPEQWVHNLEHGHIVILYDCSGLCDPNLLASLQQFAAEYPRVLVTPYAGLPRPATLAVVAWNWQMFLDHFDEDAIAGFYQRHFDHGLESEM